MAMRDRLIELIKQAKKQTKNANCDIERNMIFADYLLENGVVVPPCKVGDMVYCLYQEVGKETEIIELEIDTFEIHKDYTIIEGYVGEHCYRYFIHEIGKTVFLTKEEAEQALKGGVE